MTIDAHIEAILFYKARPVKLSYLKQVLNATHDDIQQGITDLSERLTGGVALQHNGDAVQLVTSAAASPIIEAITNEDITGDLGKASLETLTIIMYYGPVTRSEIDYIRGVNSTYSLRMLLIRGLVERIDNTSDKRAHLYQVTFDTLQLLGVTRVSDLPDFEALREDIRTFADETHTNEDELATTEETHIE